MIRWKIDQNYIIFIGQFDSPNAIINNLSVSKDVSIISGEHIVYVTRVEVSYQGISFPLFVDEDGSSWLEPGAGDIKKVENLLKSLPGFANINTSGPSNSEDN